MPVIILDTIIHSTAEVCFDLSRSIDLHQISTASSNEQAIAGITSGLIDYGEEVTWRARHFGIDQTLTSKITRFDKPLYFRDEQVKGAFKSFSHDHHFEVRGTMVIMKDVFQFESPMGIFGKIFNIIVLTSYMKKLLADRNSCIKMYAESDLWKSLPGVNSDK